MNSASPHPCPRYDRSTASRPRSVAGIPSGKSRVDPRKIGAPTSSWDRGGAKGLDVDGHSSSCSISATSFRGAARPAALGAVAPCRTDLGRRPRPPAMTCELAHPTGRAKYLLEQTRHAQIDVQGFPVKALSRRAHFNAGQLIRGDIPQPGNQLYGKPQTRTVSELDSEHSGGPIISRTLRPWLSRTESSFTLFGNADLCQDLSIREDLIRHVLPSTLPRGRPSIFPLS